MSQAIRIARLSAADRATWGHLALGYKTFYKTVIDEAAYERTWQRLQHGDGVYAWGAWLGGASSDKDRSDAAGRAAGDADRGQLVGIAHYMFHTSAWSADACYLQDLFTDDAVRGRGVARALIGAVAQSGRERGAAKLYWLTHESNQRARRLYDQVAKNLGFIRYDLALD